MAKGDASKSRKPGAKTDGPWRSKTAAVVMFAIAAGLVAFAVHVAVVAWNQDFLPDAPGIAPRNHFIDISLLLIVASGAFKWGRQLFAPSGEQVLARDHRPPVVYLRPFDEDSRCVHSGPVGERSGGHKLLDTGQPASHERKIAHALSRLGPFVAVGMPGDLLAPLGAARLYLSDDNWQAEVEALVRRAAAIVLVPETSEGTRWEVAKVVRWADPRRVLMITPHPGLRPLGYARIQKLSADCMPLALPVNAAGNVFIFDAQHRPSPLPAAKNFAKSLEAFVAQVQRLDATPP
jgi:hypothetical protein